MHPIDSSQTKPLTRQRGVAAIIMVMWLGIALICLLGVDIGYLFWQQRHLQKVADMAAIAGVGDFGPSACSASAGAQSAENALSNKHTTDSASFTATPGHWAPNGGPPPTFFSALPVGQMGFVDGRLFNACKVEVSKVVPFFFIWGGDAASSRRTLTAQATAALKPPLISLAIRNTLLDLNSTRSSLLNALVGGLLGSNVNLSLVSWQGLASADVHLLRFLDALAIQLGVQAGNYEALLQTNARVGQLIDAMISALPSNAAAQASLQVIRNQIGADVSSLNVQLARILKLDTNDPASAADIGINALEFLLASIQLVHNPVSAGGPGSNFAKMQLGLPGVATAYLRVTEPAQLSVALDPRGQQVIETRTAQVRLLLSVESSLAGAITSLLGGLTGLVTGLVTLGEVDVQIAPGMPFRIDALMEAGNGHARVMRHACSVADDPAGRHVEAKVRSAALDLYLGKLGNTQQDAIQAAFAPSIPQVKPIPLVDIGRCGSLGCLLSGRTPFYYGGLGLKAHLPVLAHEGMLQLPAMRNVDEPLRDTDYATLSSPNPLGSLGATVKGLQLLHYIDPTGQPGGVLSFLVDLINTLTTGLLNAVLTLLTPLTSVLDTLLNDLLSLLGIQLTKTEVAARMNCNPRAELVH